MCLTEYSTAELYRELLLREDASFIKTPYDIIKHVKPYIGAQNEYFLVCILNGAHRITEVIEITKGTLNNVLAHPREVFKPAILSNAVDIILVHNHPSGRLVPSDSDDKLTRRMVQAGEIIGINVIDHVIIGNDTRCYSYLDHDRINL